jgi:hypothetical protein
MIFVFWAAFSVAVGVFASVRRNRNGFGWGLLAMVISPLLAGVFCAILREKVGPQQGGHDFLARTGDLPAFADLPASEQARLRQLRNDLGRRS